MKGTLQCRHIYQPDGAAGQVEHQFLNTGLAVARGGHPTTFGAGTIIRVRDAALRDSHITVSAKSGAVHYFTLTDLEAVFRSLKSELGLRPIYHHKPIRADGHLFITVIAYQLVQVLQRFELLRRNAIGIRWVSSQIVPADVTGSLRPATVGFQPHSV